MLIIQLAIMAISILYGRTFITKTVNQFIDDEYDRWEAKNNQIITTNIVQFNTSEIPPPTTTSTSTYVAGFASSGYASVSSGSSESSLTT
jgi:hypothetical protein